MSNIFKKGADKVIDSKAVNFLMPVKKSKDRIEDVLKFKTTRKLLKKQTSFGRNRINR